jgi:hypothetical protein
MPTPDVVPDPWGAFFFDLDSALTEEVCLHCIGGFVVSVCYQLNRPTADVDFVEVIPKIKATFCGLSVETVRRCTAGTACTCST